MRIHEEMTFAGTLRHRLTLHAKLRYHFWNVWVRPFSLLEFLVRRNPRKYQPQAPSFRPDFWKDVLDEANCYMYAHGVHPEVFLSPHVWYLPAEILITDQDRFETDSKMRPDGSLVAANAPRARARQKISLLRGLLKTDGLKKATLRSLRGRPEDRYLVAALYAPYTNQMHFVRLDSSGQWSHKSGMLVANQKDEAGHVIRTPRRIASTARYRFVGYFWVFPDESPMINDVKAQVRRSCADKGLPAPDFQPFPV